MIDFTDHYGDIVCKNIFYNLFQNIPSEFTVKQIKSKGLLIDLKNKHKERIIHFTIENSYFTKESRNYRGDVIVAFDSGEMLIAESNTLTYLYNKEELFSENYFKEEAQKYLDETDEPTLRMFVNNHNGFEAEQFKIEKVNIDLENNYNEDIKLFNENLFRLLNDISIKGLHLFYGLPGTGKTNFLRHITATVKRDVLFIPSGMTEILSSPSFFKQLTNHTGGLLIIEDAEKAITARESSDNNAVSTLLNISDGLLSDVLKMQIICTFNTDISKLDKALLRPGRLLSKYEFKELELNKSKNLAAKLGLKRIIAKPHTIAELYNDKDAELVEFSTRKVVGFN